MPEHFAFADQANINDWVAPTHAVPVASAEVNPTDEYLTNEDTGAGRARRPGISGPRSVGGTVETKLYGKTVGRLLRAPYGTRAASIVAGGFRTVLTPDDDAEITPQSLQEIFRTAVTARAQSIRGAKLNAYDVGVEGTGFASLGLDYVAKDAAFTGGAWADGEAAPAVADPSVLYATGQTVPLTFKNGVLRIGGSLDTTYDDNAWLATAAMANGAYTLLAPSLPAGFTSLPVTVKHTANGTVDVLGTITVVGTDVDDDPLTEVLTPVSGSTVRTVGLFKTVTSATQAGWTTAAGADTIIIGWGYPNGEGALVGGTDRCDIANIGLSFDFNIATDDYPICLGDATVASLDEGNRVGQLTFDANFRQVWGEFYELARSGDRLTAELFFQGGFLAGSSGPRYEYVWRLPYLQVATAPTPAINAAYGLKRTSVTAEIVGDDDLGYDHQLVIQSTENYAA